MTTATGSGRRTCGPSMRCDRCCQPGSPRVNEIIRLIGAHNLLTTPRAAEFADPSLRRLIDTYLPGVAGVSAERRAHIFRLAWDFAGSALGSRNEQYERFYLASGARNLQRAHEIASRTRADRLVDRFLDEEPWRPADKGRTGPHRPPQMRMEGPDARRRNIQAHRGWGSDAARLAYAFDAQRIVNAVLDALAPLGIKRLRPERVWRAIQKAQRS